MKHFLIHRRILALLMEKITVQRWQKHNWSYSVHEMPRLDVPALTGESRR